MTDQLIDLPSVTQLSPSVVRILGGNPGKFTLQGTNTYLISEGRPSSSSVPCILIDTGEGADSYPAVLQRVLLGEDERSGSVKRHISDIILTHRHHDHVGGLPSVLQLLSELRHPPPRLHKYPDPATDETLHARLRQLPATMYKAHHALDGPVLIKALKEGDEISIEEEDEDDGEKGRSTLRVIHSPGHTTDHVCLFFSKERALFTGDHVLGQGTSVFEDLGSYLRSLQKCWNILQEVSPDEERLLYPAHGPTIEAGKEALQGYLSHRLEREHQILELLSTPSEGSATSTPLEEEASRERGAGWTIKSIVSKLYSNYPEHLYPAAARGVFLHLRKLALPDVEAIERGVIGRENEGRRVECFGPGAGKGGLAPAMPSGDSEWIHLMSLQWRLLGSGDDGASKKTSRNGSGVGLDLSSL
ncbi:hypothetical protein CBS101457_005309 [Exobasidium rhododendri]|nr:hypothetical protein CBS101457_005309 [Exobasidium rhododendri]